MSPNVQTWIGAMRLRTLPLALSSIGMGSFLAATYGSFNGLIFILCVLTTVFLQILSNLANDYGDSVNGADNSERKGPSRAVQTGAITLRQMKSAIAVFIGLALASGISLLYVSLGFNLNSFIYFFALGIASIVAAYTYTAGSKPYGYAGLGDLSVLIFFGFVGVLGSLYLFTGNILAIHVLPAISCGFFAMAVLNINNIRDIDSDKLAGKFSLPVRKGRTWAVKYHWVLIVGGLGTTIAFTLFNYSSLTQWLFLITLPLFIINGRAIQNQTDPLKIDPYLKQMALTTLLFVVSFGIGNILV